jgi:hypothetical protein
MISGLVRTGISQRDLSGEGLTDRMKALNHVIAPNDEEIKIHKPVDTDHIDNLL